MTKFLNRNIPFIHPSKKDFWVDVFIGALTYFILVVFQPFGISSSMVSYLELKLLGFGLIAGVSSALFQRIIPLRVPQYFNAQSWTIGKGVLVSLSAFVFMGFCSWVYFQLFFKGDPFYPSFFECFLYTFAVGLLPFIVFVFQDYVVFLESKSGINALDSPTVPSPESYISIGNASSSDSITIGESKIIAASAMGNYVSLYYLSDAGLKRYTTRKTISSLAKDLPGDNFVRCHRSHIVNMNYVLKGEGNTKGFMLTLDHIDDTIQVSRNYVTAIRHILSETDKG